MRFRLSLVVVALSVVLLVAGCNQQPVPAPMVTSLTSSSVTLAASGGSTTLTWTGSGVTDYSLTVSPSTGVQVNGSAYSGSVDLATSTSASVTLPSNGTSRNVAYTFTLTAAGGKGTTASTKTVKVTVGAANPAIGSFSANPSSLASSGGSSALSWSGSAVTDYALTVSPSAGVQVNGTAFNGSVDLATSTSASVTLPSNGTSRGVAYTFTLTASGVSGTAPATKTVTVAVGAASPAIGSFTASPASLSASGGSSSLSWSGSAVTDYALTVSPSAGVQVNGAAYAGAVDVGASTSASVTLPGNTSSGAASYTFTLTASGVSGTAPATKTVTVAVGAANPAIGSFSANPSSLASSGGSSALSWSGSAVTDYALTVSPSAGVQVNGTAFNGSVDLATSTSASVTLPSNGTSGSVAYTFTLTASGVSGTAPATMTVTVAVGAANPVIGSFSANPSSLGSSGGSATLTWTGSAVTDYSLTVSPSTGVQVNGTAYGGSVDLATSTSASVTLPSNGTSGSVAYTFTLTAAGGKGTTASTKTVTVSQTPNQLSVSPSGVTLDSSTPQTVVTLSNTSSTSTAWTAAASDGHVTVSPAQATLAAGSSTSVTVSVDGSGLSQGQTITPTVTFDSSVGKATLDVSFTMTVGGLAQCGQIPTTLSVASVAGSATPNSAPVHPTAIAPDGRSYVPGEILVSYSTGAAPQSAGGGPRALQQLSADLRSSYGLQLVQASAPGAPDLVKTTDALATLARLRADPRVKAAQLNYYLTPQAPVNDPYYGQEWTMQEFGMEQAWGTETGASNPTVIAIIDTGVQMNHPDLQAKMVGGCDFYDGDNNPTPGPGVNHGTHVAGIAAAIGNNNAGVAGVAYALNARIEPIKIFDDYGAGATTSMLIDAIRWAAGLAVSNTATNPNPADVINMSVGIPGDQPLIDQAAAAAFNAGSLLVASAGNYGTGTPNPSNPGVLSPANAPDVIAVGSVDSDNQISGFSAYSTGAPFTTGVEVMAPGGFEVSPSYTGGSCAYNYYSATAPDYGIVSTYTGSNYGCDVGTSMASPFVAGVAALLKSHTPSLNPTQLRQTLDNTALFEAGMTTDEYGHGIVCADRALDPLSTTQCGQ